MRLASTICAENIVEKILVNLIDRSGIGDAIAGIDNETYDDLEQTLVEIAEHEIEKAYP